jgi:threonine/homoserine/homoserine lactone efflux protein
MPSVDTQLVFFMASILLALTPGPDNLFVLAQAAQHGKMAGIAVTMGLCTGLLLHTAAVSLGVAAIFQASALAFALLKYIGAAYLLYLGIGYLTSRSGIKLSDQSAALPPWRQVATGFLTLWGNPKALLFFGAFIPQFVDPHYLAWPQVVVLGLIEIGAAALTDGGYIALSVGARSLLTGGALIWVNRVAGVILIGASIWLATLSRS